MNIPGVSAALGHDASAALFVDAELVAAVAEGILQTDHPSPGITSPSMWFFAGLFFTD